MTPVPVIPTGEAGRTADSTAKHRDRAIQAIAEHRCSTDLTDGFCGPRDGKCQHHPVNRMGRDCGHQAEGVLHFIESRGMSVIWNYDKRRVEMPLFMCSKCGSVENTALSEYWRQEMDAHEKGEPLKPLCSACNPEIGQWHGQFDRKSAEDYVTDARGKYIYSKVETEKYFKDRGPFKPVVLPTAEPSLCPGKTPK